MIYFYIILLSFFVLLACQKPKRLFPIDKIDKKSTLVEYKRFVFKKLYKANCFYPEKYDTNNYKLVDSMYYWRYPHAPICTYISSKFTGLLDSLTQKNTCLFGDTLEVLLYTQNDCVGRFIFHANVGLTKTAQVMGRITHKETKLYDCETDTVKLRDFFDMRETRDFYDNKETQKFVYRDSLTTQKIKKREIIRSIHTDNAIIYFRFVRLPNDSVKLDDMALYLY